MKKEKKITINNKRFDKNKIILIINIVFLLSINIYLCMCFARSILKPKNIIENENRYAEKYKDINFKNFILKSLQDNIENVLSDQTIFSRKLRLTNNYTKAMIVKKYINSFLSDNDLRYLNSKDVFFYGKNNLVYRLESLYSMKELFDFKIENYNKLMKNYKNLDFYFYYVEKDTDINFRNNKKNGVYEYIKEKMESKNFSRLKIDNFEQYKEYFYETDHHWNYKGSYQAYKDVLDLLKIKDEPIVGDEKCLDIYWSGSKAKKSIYDKVLSESFCAYKFNFDNMKILVNGVEREDYGNQDAYFNKSNLNDVSYGSFYGDDGGEIIFDTGNSKKENILIIGESYDNAILKLIASHYNKTISIDLRNYNNHMKKEFDFEEYIKKYKIKKVLFIGNIYFYTMKEFMIGEDK